MLLKRRFHFSPFHHINNRPLYPLVASAWLRVRPLGNEELPMATRRGATAIEIAFFFPSSPRFGALVMETTPRSANKMGLASALTALNVAVASGFSIAGLIKPELVLPAGATPTDASAIFAMYAAARTIPLALTTMVAIYKGSASALLVLGLLAGIIQFADAAVGLLQHDIGKTVGPLFLAILQVYAVTIFWKVSKATSN
jgi:hypothetical protein